MPTVIIDTPRKGRPAGTRFRNGTAVNAAGNLVGPERPAPPPGRWYNAAGNLVGPGTPGSPESVGGYILSPAEQNYRNTLSPEMRALFDVEFADKKKIEAQTQAENDASLATLRSTQERLGRTQSEFADDPDATFLLSELRRRSDPNFRVLTPEEEAVGRNAISADYARNVEAIRAGASRAGVYGSAPSDAREAHINALARSNEARYGAQVAGINDTARQTALWALGTFGNSRDQLELSISDELSRTEQAIAQVESGIQYAPSDYAPFGQLDFERQQYADEISRFDAEWAAAEKAGNIDAFDIGNFFVNLRGTRFFDAVGGLLGG